MSWRLGTRTYLPPCGGKDLKDPPFTGRYQGTSRIDPTWVDVGSVLCDLPREHTEVFSYGIKSGDFHVCLPHDEYFLIKRETITPIY